jgi:limonene-1,2-epoxide hydrolase
VSEPRSSGEIVRAFCAAWERGDFDRFGEFLADDAVLQMIPLEPRRGLAAIREECEKLASLGRVEIRILHLADAGGVVFTERIDALHAPTRTGELPVAGIFELRDGRITAWRDYFDLPQALAAFGLAEPI